MTKHVTKVAAGQTWRHPELPITYRVLGVVEGWVVYRAPRCQPCVAWWRDFERNCVLVRSEPGKTFSHGEARRQ